MGLDVIATYVPWEYHEYKKGVFDFTGRTDPQRNLVAYLDLLKRMGFWVLFRPGPYIYSEWVNCGVPDWVVKYHRNHPEFKKLAMPYIREVSKVVKPYLATNGGNVILFQPDNEIDIWSTIYEEDLGLDSKTGLFQEFLLVKYKDIKNLNSAWGTRLKSFKSAQAVTENIIDEPSYRKRYLDFCQFKHFFCTSCAKWISSAFRKAGIDVPMYLNTYHHLTIQNWRELQKIVDIVGIDMYPTEEMTLRKDEQRQFLEKIRYTRTFSAIPYIAEFESGTWRGSSVRFAKNVPNHYRLICLSALQAGIAGWNWYMLVNRDNWYMSPINEWARRDTMYDTFKDIVALYREMNPADAEKLSQTAVTLNVAHYATATIDEKEHVLSSLYEADIDYEFFDTETGNIAKKILFYSGNQWLDIKSQKKLREYVEKGGILVVFQEWPRTDDNFKPANLLGIKEPDRIHRSKQLQIKLGRFKPVMTSPAFGYNKVPGKEITATCMFTKSILEESDSFARIPEGRKYTVGYIQNKKQGKLVVLGVQPDRNLLIAIHDYFGIPTYSRSQIQGVTTALFKQGKEYFLVATNNNTEEKHVNVLLEKRLFDKEKWIVTDLFNGKQSHLQSPGELTVHIPAKDGTIIKIHSLQ